jgi:hypothetical protein
MFTDRGQTYVALRGSGYATGMGHITNDGTAVIDRTVHVLSCPGGLFNVNTEKFTDIESPHYGDTLTITSTDVACPIGPGPGKYHGHGEWKVTGGTGWFDGTTGEGTLDGDSDFNAGTFMFTATGTLVHE